MEETTLAYTAGLIDGEGYVGLMKNRSAKDSFIPTVKVASTDPHMVPFLNETWGGWIEWRRPPNKTKNSKASLCWVICNKPQLQEFLLMIYPYLRVKKAQAEVLISYIQNCPYRKTLDTVTRKYVMNPEILQSRYDHFNQIRELNRRGLHLQRLSEEAPNGSAEGEATVRTNGNQKPLEA